VYRINTRVVTVDVPPQDVITKDNVTLTVNAVVFFRVLHPKDAVVNGEDFYAATYQKAQTVLRNVLGQSELDELLAGRDAIHLKLQAILDAETDQWEIKVEAVEIKHVDLPRAIQRAMARQAEAERERRSKVIAAEGEFQASTRLAEAAAIMGRHPMSLQLRFLQTPPGSSFEVCHPHNRIARSGSTDSRTRACHQPTALDARAPNPGIPLVAERTATRRSEDLERWSEKRSRIVLIRWQSSTGIRTYSSRFPVSLRA
jgi:hypothetical protein